MFCDDSFEFLPDITASHVLRNTVRSYRELARSCFDDLEGAAIRPLATEKDASTLWGTGRG